MAELEIDQSNLPRVREDSHNTVVDSVSTPVVNRAASRSFPSSMMPPSAPSALCQCFAVLEDGALAHNLQEQEIEQYYTTNIQKNQLVQNDIRVAKQLQDEEEEQGAQQRAVLRQASRQLEEDDFEYARVIQEELQQCAAEARRRELDDEEIAKRLQEEEEQLIRSKNRRSHSEEGAAHQRTQHSPDEDGERFSPAATRWQHSASHSHADQTRTRRAASLGGVGAQRSTTSWSNQGHADSIRQIRQELRAALSEDSEDSDTVLSEQLAVWSRRANERGNTAPPQRRASFRYPQERDYRSLQPRSSFTGEFRSCDVESGELEEDYYDDGDYYDRDKRRLRSRRQEGGHTEDGGRRLEDRGSRFAEERRCSRSESVRSHDRGHRDLARTWSCRDNGDKRVHFQDDGGSQNGRRGDSRQVWEMLGQVLRERGVPVTVGANGVPLQIGPQSRDGHGSEVSCGSSQTHHRGFQRAAAARHSFHGDVRKRRRSSRLESGGGDHRDEGDARCDNAAGVYGISAPDLAERRGSRRWRRHGYAHEDGEGNANGVKRSTSQRGPRHATDGERLWPEEEAEERRVEWPPRRAPQRSQSLSSSSRAANRDRWRHGIAGVSPQPHPPGETSLDLGELQQVLRDEELARNLQDEEEKRMRRKSQPPVRGVYPQGDFRVAQVAQDEEIARFMQKQEIKTKRRSRELEGPASWREHRAMIGHHDRRATRERQVPRERLDSEGLPSPTEDCFPENQPPSPNSTLTAAQQIKNIAEELDPTFQARRLEPELPLQDQRGPDSPSAPLPHSGLSDFLAEPAFVPPTKRQAEKSARAKPKEKKENCKQQ